MTSKLPGLTFVVLTFLSLTFSPFVASSQSKPTAIGHGYDFEGNGKDITAATLPLLYTKKESSEGLRQALEHSDSALIVSLKNQYRYLFLKDPDQNHNLENLKPTNEKLRNTLRALIQSIENPTTASSFSLYQIKGEDGKGNVHFTAYFTPVLDASPIATEKYKYPIYKKPSESGQKPLTRKQIDGQGALKNKGLEVAWTSSLLENYFLQVQGSGYAAFPDGSLQFLAFNGQNGLPYSSLGKYMIAQGHISESDISLQSIRNWFEQNPDSLETILYKNQSYTFLAPVKEEPKGAYGFPLTPEHSIAVDTQFIPLGAVLLARLPVLDESGKLLRHDFTIVTAQDKGGAIKGPGHVDVYMGVGDEALKKASAMHHYGNLWLILAE
ncbi:MAG: murein transglycosylase A [Imperialibacter sp.]|uniref:murein transglycosylase A n=1 Tax=Imperialibacter sp. TaxID=2038411 RepID=UPI003A89998F